MMEAAIILRPRQHPPIIFLCGFWAAFFAPRFVLAQSLADVLKQPSVFDQQIITVIGQVVQATTRYGETVSTTLQLLDAQGAAITVLVSDVPKCRLGEICRVSGLFVAQRSLLLPEKIERIAERPPVSAGVLFRQRSSDGSAFGGRSWRELYIPQ
jgi:hypothetical protein